MKISIYARYAKERFETARQYSFCIMNESSDNRKECERVVACRNANPGPDTALGKTTPVKPRSR